MRHAEVAEVVTHLSSPGLRAAVVEGEAGIGKSTLLGEIAAALADVDGARVLWMRAAEPDREIAFGGLGDLLDDELLDRWAGQLAGPRRRALDAALLRVDSREPVDARAVGLAVADTLGPLARSRPTVVVIDDVQWCDEQTLAALRIAVRRLSAVQLRLLLARRTGEAATEEPLLAAVPVDRRLR
ncbi:MAG: ATP-binding protein, partial [Ilumatobacteraceae bacterium]|nr:ATP-binding protein [Ilumatobacteraceae bacterium]